MIAYTPNTYAFKGNKYPTCDKTDFANKIKNGEQLYEVTNDTKPCKLYFDVDYKLTNEEFDNDTAAFIEQRGEFYISSFIQNNFNIQPNIAIATSHCHEKYSVRYFVSNIIAPKKEIHSLVIDINKYIETAFDGNDNVFSVIENNHKGFFDTQVYSFERKMRCVNTSKPKENRPLLLKKGSVEQTIITDYFDDNFKQVSYSPGATDEDGLTDNEDNSTLTDEETALNDIDYLLLVCIKDKMCGEGDNEAWTIIGQSLKNELGTQATEPFLKWTLQFGSQNKKNEAYNHITKYIKKTPSKQEKKLTIKTIHFHARKCNPTKYKARFCKGNSNELTKDIKVIIDNATDYEFANYFCKRWGNDFKCIDVKNKIYYRLTNKKLWEQFEQGTYIREILSNEMYQELFKYKDVLTEAMKKFNENTDEYEAIKNQLKQFTDLIKKIQRATDKNNILREISDKLFDSEFPKKLNKQFDLLPIKDNKVFDITSNLLIDRNQEHYFDFECPVSYIEMSQEQELDIKQYFLDLFCANELTMSCVIDILKSLFFGKQLRYIFFFTGEGRNGKSLLFKLLQNIFKKRMDAIDKRVILEIKGNSTMTTQFEKLDKCKFAYITELQETDILNATTIKQISGGDPIDYRGLYKTNQTIQPTCSLGALTNKLPELPKNDNALLDRIIVIPFNNRFEVDNTFEDVMLSKLDLIFSFIIKNGTIRDKFELTEEMKVAKDEYIEDNEKIDYLKEFLDEKFIIIPFVKTERVKRSVFRQAYNHFLKEKGMPLDHSGEGKFTRVLRKYNLGTQRSNHIEYITGLVEKQLDEEDDDVLDE